MTLATTIPTVPADASMSGAGASLADDLARILRNDSGMADAHTVRETEAALEILGRAAGVGNEALRTFVASAQWWRETPTALFCDEFLAPGELAELKSYVLMHENEFAPATLVDAEEGKVFVDRSFRLSETLFVLGPFRSLFETRVRRYLDFVCARLDRPPFDRPIFELQLTATRNGGFFRDHDDNSHPGNRSRRLTFVYYFFFEPLIRSGGALRFNQRSARFAPFDVLPVHNRVVFFDSAIRHEVRPFVSESDAFVASRFTVNGWVHQDTWP